MLIVRNKPRNAYGSESFWNGTGGKDNDGYGNSETLVFYVDVGRLISSFSSHIRGRDVQYHRNIQLPSPNHIQNMSVFSITPKDGNPVTPKVFDTVCSTLNVTVGDATEKEDLRKLLAVFHEAAEDIMALPDLELFTDLERYPRENVHYPERKDNEYGAWAWKVRIEDKSKENKGIMKGRTVVVKDNIAIATVSMLMGTNFVKNYTPVCKSPQFQLPVN
jgi:hypothetical protein